MTGLRQRRRRPHTGARRRDDGSPRRRCANGPPPPGASANSNAMASADTPARPVMDFAPWPIQIAVYAALVIGLAVFAARERRRWRRNRNSPT